MPRGLPPHRIRQWASTASSLAESDSTVDVGFIVAYSAWEALQCRILAVALVKQGYSIAVAHEYLGSSQLNDRQYVKHQFSAILGRAPQQTSGLSVHWKILDSWSHHRNGLVHGLSHYRPDILRAGVADIVERVLDTSWLDHVLVPRELGDEWRSGVPLGDVMAAQRGGTRNGQTAQQLARRVRDLRTK